MKCRADHWFGDPADPDGYSSSCELEDDHKGNHEDAIGRTWPNPDAKWRHIMRDVMQELAQARQEHPPMHSAHEGLSIMEEEVDETRREVYRNPRKWPDYKQRIRAEAVQVAAMAIRLIGDVCDSD